MKQWNWRGLGMVVLLGLVVAARVRPGAALDAEDQPDPARALQPGLITTYRDTATPNPNQFTTVEPTIALSLKAEEAPHPRLRADSFTARWEGQLKVLRKGKYRFAAHLRGKFKLVVNGQEALAAEVTDGDVELKRGPELTLEAGTYPLVADFTKVPGAARVLVQWQAAHFLPEPLPHDVLGHLANQRTEKLESDYRIERGRFLAEEHSCSACHQPSERDQAAKGLKNRQGPDLSKAGERFSPEWMVQWLLQPQQHRPTAVMPRLFGDTKEGKVEAFAVAQYLASLGGPMKPVQDKTKPNDLRASIGRGERLFSAVGCAVCHHVDEQADKSNPARHALRGMGSKTTTEQLAKYLQNPLAIDPSGRMPNMLLSGAEALDMARYLCQDTLPPMDIGKPDRSEALKAYQRLEPKAEKTDEFHKLSEEKQWLALGQRLVIEKHCTACHTIAPGGKALATTHAQSSLDQLKKSAVQDRGCLSTTNDKGVSPTFAFPGEDKKALRAYLLSEPARKDSPAPAHAARIALERFNCLGCHVRNGVGGLSTEMTDLLRKVESAENAEAVSPPPLTGVGQKLMTPWLRQVLTGGGRARPWMSLRMPQFGPENVGHLPGALAALDGAEPADKPQGPAYHAANVEQGRLLVGKKAFGCIACHDLAGVVAAGTRGPDLAFMQQRVQYDWYRRWLEQPQRMQPGTRMPSIFTDGRSIIDQVLDGHGDKQAEAIWTYLSLGSNLPLPEGLEPPKGLVLTVKDRPVLLRTFMPDAGSKAIAVGYPGEVSVAFDAATCRLAYAWSGNFLDAAPVWNDRGGSPAKLLGPRFWESPRGFPWAFTAENRLPDFIAQSRDPAFGASPGDGKVHSGPMRLTFEGHVTDKEGWPTFNYVTAVKENLNIEIRERIEPQRRPAAIGLTRQFVFTQPAGTTAWLLAGETKGEPRFLDAQGHETKLDLKKAEHELPASGGLLILPQTGDRLTVLQLGESIDGACWRLQRQDGVWQAILRLPASTQPAERSLALRVWQPYRNDDKMIQELLTPNPSK